MSRVRRIVLAALWVVGAALGTPAGIAHAGDPASECRGVALGAGSIQAPKGASCPSAKHKSLLVTGFVEFGDDPAQGPAFRGQVQDPSGARHLMCWCNSPDNCSMELYYCEGYGGPDGCAACCSEGCGLGPLTGHSLCPSTE